MTELLAALTAEKETLISELETAGSEKSAIARKLQEAETALQENTQALTAAQTAAQEAAAGDSISVNAAQKAGANVADIREALKDKISRMAGQQEKAKQEGDPEVKLNLGQDLNTARSAIIDAGGDPLFALRLPWILR